MRRMSEAPHGSPAHAPRTRLRALVASGRALAAFQATRDANAVPGYRERVREFEDFMGYREFAERARRYGAS